MAKVFLVVALALLATSCTAKSTRKAQQLRGLFDFFNSLGGEEYDAGCTTVQLESGDVYRIEYPDDDSQYSNHADKCWDVETTDGSGILVDIKRMDIELAYNCMYDAITLYDRDMEPISSLCGEYRKDPDIGNWCNLKTFDTKMRIKFASDVSVTGDGFTLVLKTGEYEGVSFQCPDENQGVMDYDVWWPSYPSIPSDFSSGSYPHFSSGSYPHYSSGSYSSGSSGSYPHFSSGSYSSGSSGSYPSYSSWDASYSSGSGSGSYSSGSSFSSGSGSYSSGSSFSSGSGSYSSWDASYSSGSDWYYDSDCDDSYYESDMSGSGSGSYSSGSSFSSGSGSYSSGSGSYSSGSGSGSSYGSAMPSLNKREMLKNLLRYLSTRKV